MNATRIRDFDRFTCLVMPEWFQLDFVHFFSPSQYDAKTMVDIENGPFLSVTLKDMSILKVAT